MVEEKEKAVSLLIVTEYGPLLIANIPQAVADDTEERLGRESKLLFIMQSENLSNVVVSRRDYDTND